MPAKVARNASPQKNSIRMWFEMKIGDKVKVTLAEDWYGVVKWISDTSDVVHVETDGAIYRLSKNVLDVV